MGSARVWDERTRALHAARHGDASPSSGAALPVPAPRAVPGDELAALVAGIVQVTLDTHLAEPEPGLRVQLARELERRLLELFGAPPPRAVEAQGSVANAEDEAGDVPPSMAVTAGQDAPGSASPHEAASPSERAIGQSLQDRLLRLGGALAVRADLRERLIGLALERLASPAEASAASGDELLSLDVLQRRAAKLERSLQEARSALAYVSGLEHVDTGIASVYRVVQGLSPEDPGRERKRAALECLFRANLALREPRV